MRKVFCVSLSLFLLAVTAHEDAHALLQAERLSPKKVAVAEHRSKDDDADLQSMKMSQLRKLAKEQGASNEELDAAEDADLPKDAMIELIERGPNGPATTLAFGVPSDTASFATVATDASGEVASAHCQEFAAELQSTVQKLEAEHEKLVEQLATVRALAKESATAASETLQSTAESDVETRVEALSDSSEADDAAAESEAATSTGTAEVFETAKAEVEDSVQSSDTSHADAESDASTIDSDTSHADAESDASTSAGDEAAVDFVLSASDQRCDNYEAINLGTTSAKDLSTTAECGAFCKENAECVGFAWSRTSTDVMHCLLWKGACEMVAETEWDQYTMKARQ